MQECWGDIILCNNSLELWNITSGHKGTNNVWIKGSEEPVKNIDCDVQPYSSELLKKEYGCEEECTKRIFMDPDANIKMGSILKDNVKKISYLVNRVIDWDDHMELMCKEI